jgi:hypothetical protein
VSATVCKRCGRACGAAEYRYEAVTYPYNPEWPLTRIDAGVFCSDGCLAAYLAREPSDGEAVEAAR